MQVEKVAMSCGAITFQRREWVPAVEEGKTQHKPLIYSPDSGLDAPAPSETEFPRFEPIKHNRATARSCHTELPLRHWIGAVGHRLHEHQRLADV